MNDDPDRLIIIVSVAAIALVFGLMLLFSVVMAGWKDTGIGIFIILCIGAIINIGAAHSDRAIEKGKKPNLAFFIFSYWPTMGGNPWPASSYIKGFSLLVFTFLCIVFALVVFDSSKQEPIRVKAVDGKVLNFPD